MKQKYNQYFKKHYKLHYDDRNVKLYQKWFYSQWKEIIKYFEFSKAKSILEIGSGIGTFYGCLRENSNTAYIGLEMDSDAVKFTNKYYNAKSFIGKSIEEFKSKDKFDGIFAFEVLEHLDNPPEVVRKMYSMLRDDGYFVGTSPYPFLKNVVADNTHKYVLHPESWKKMFLENKFKEVNVYPMSFFPFIWRLNKHVNICMPFYIPFNNFISTTLIVAKK